LSNYINHHQLPFCDSMYKKLDGNFIFIQTEPMEQERKDMGWNSDISNIPYLKCLYDEEETCNNLILNCDVLIAGWTNRLEKVIERMQAHKLTIRIYERIYREGQWKALSPRGLIAKYKEHTRFRKGPAYLLCAGAYVASDFNIIKAYPNKMYKFGYFPELMKYDFRELMRKKNEDDTIRIIFAGRFMELKHPEFALMLARDLSKTEGIPKFEIHMVGSGQLENQLKEMAATYGVEDKVIFYGFKTPEEVRQIMEMCHIQLFCSNALEGWGAVVNEAMNSGCVPVASVNAGAVPYLIKQNQNGIAYEHDDYEKMKEAVIFLLKNDENRYKMAENAYNTIASVWNSDYAADTLINMIEGWINNEENPPSDGPLSKAPVIAPSKMFKYMEKDKGR